MEFLKEISVRLDQAAAGQLTGGGKQITAMQVECKSLFRGFAEELDRFDTMDFDPLVRAEFVEQRSVIRQLAKLDTGVSDRVYATTASGILPIIDKYRGAGSGAITRDFSRVNNLHVRAIVERDYAELMLRSYPDKAWKSAVILAGSILEAVLYDRLIKDQQTITTAMNSAKAPTYGKHPNQKKKDLKKRTRKHQWTLNDMIVVAADIGLLPPADEVAIHQVLREYRNFVHPLVEIRRGVSITPGRATSAVGMLDVVLDDLKP